MAEHRIIQRRAHSGNYARGRGGRMPHSISNHVSMGPLEQTLSWFENPNANVSSSYVIAEDGTIYQPVPGEDTPFTNGPLRNPNTAAVPWLAGPVDPLYGANPYTVTIEWIGAHKGGSWQPTLWKSIGYDVWKPGRNGQWWTPTPEQWEAGVWLHRQLMAVFGIAADRAHIIRHSDVDSVTKSYCPGQGFNLGALLAELAIPAETDPAPMLHIDIVEHRKKPIDVSGPPGISADHLALILTRLGSPARHEADEIWRRVVLHYKRPEVLQAFFERESHSGTDVYSATVLHDLRNAGHLRPPVSWTPPGVVRTLPTHWGNFLQFATWADGFEAMAILFSKPFYADLPDLRARIHQFAPSFDGNAPDKYADFVIARATQYLAEGSNFSYPDPTAG